MFNLGEFVKRGFLNAVGKMSDYQIILNAAGWHDKGVLAETDLEEIQGAIERKNALLKVSTAEVGQITETETETETETGTVEVDEAEQTEISEQADIDNSEIAEQKEA